MRVRMLVLNFLFSFLISLTTVSQLATALANVAPSSATLRTVNRSNRTTTLFDNSDRVSERISINKEGNSAGQRQSEPYFSPNIMTDETEVVAMPSSFLTEGVMEFDHYNGVTLHPSQLSSTETFESDLQQALKVWKAEGRRGIWVFLSKDEAHLVPLCIQEGFDFHSVKQDNLHQKDQSENISIPNGNHPHHHRLVLTQWLEGNSPSRLPLGPTHQIGVGIVVLKPDDPSKMLCVQELTGPAAAMKLWKMPTGLLDPQEDIPDAAQRELLEETGLKATMKGVLCFRQAHSDRRTSDLFFVCQMVLDEPTVGEDGKLQEQQWILQKEEIADIQWMPVRDYCSQERWQGSPVYERLNESIQKVSDSSVRLREQQADASSKDSALIMHEQLPLGFSTTATNALFRSQL